MKVEKAVVDYRKEGRSSGYRLTVYIGLEVDSGPEYQVLLTSIQDLYMVFNTFSKSESFKTAEFCLKLGYNVLAQRVNKITGRASCRMFSCPNGDGTYFPRFSSPREDKDYSIRTEVDIGTGIMTSEGEVNPLYSLILNFKHFENSDNLQLRDDFALIVPKSLNTLQGVSIFQTFALLGPAYATDHRFDSITYKKYITTSLTYTNYKEVVLEFLKDFCSFTIEEEDDEYYYIYSNSMIQNFDCRNFTFVNSSEDIMSFTESSIGYRDNQCFEYDNYKTCTLYSKHDSCIDDIEVKISKSNGFYYVTGYKIANDNSVIYTETFTYSTDSSQPNYITNLSRDSRLVELELFDETKDLSGDYKLLGRTNLVTDKDYYDSVFQEEGEEEKSYNADICLDMSDHYQDSYIKNLLKWFPNSLVFTSYGSSLSRVVSINPDIIWNQDKVQRKGFTYLLFMLLENDNISDSDLIKLTKVNSNLEDVSTMITKDDYDISLMGVVSKVSSNSSYLPIRTAVSIVSIENFILSSDHSSYSDFVESVTNANKYVNDYLKTKTKVEIVSASLYDRRLVAILNFSVNNIIVSSYRIVATILE